MRFRQLAFNVGEIEGLLVVGSLIPMTHFPRLNEARHYNGIGIIDFMPFVFGGWNNGSTGTVEYLDERSDSPKWRCVKMLCINDRLRTQFLIFGPSASQSCDDPYQMQ